MIDFQAESLDSMHPAGYLGKAFTELPVRIRIADIDLLGYVRDGEDEPSSFRWYKLPILDIARWGLLAIRCARENGQSSVELGPYGDSGSALLFKMSEGEKILVHSTMTEKTVSLSYNRLEAVWEAFAERVRDYTIQEYPEMQTVPYWADWLKGQYDPCAWDIPPILLMTSEILFAENANSFDRIDASEE